MVGKTALAAFAASALLLAGGQSAFAADDGIPFEKLIEVTVDTQGEVTNVVGNFDAAEYKRVEADGRITLNVFVTADEEARLRKLGYEIGRTIEDSHTGPQRMSERQEIIDQEELAKTVAEQGLKGAKFEGRAVAELPGDTVVQRANTFTDLVGVAPTTGRRASSTSRHTTSRPATPPTARSSARRSPCRTRVPTATTSRPLNMGRFNDTDTDARRVHVPPGPVPPARPTPGDVKTVRVATTATTGGAAASVQTFPVTEWLGTDLPPHVAGFKNQPFFTKYMDPTENRADLDALAALYPELMSVVNMPEKTSGYQRKSQATMFGTTAITGTPPVTLGPNLLPITTGEITTAQPVVVSRSRHREDRPVRARRGDGIPALDRLRPHVEGSQRSGHAGDRHRHEPGDGRSDVPADGTYTYEISGYQGALGDFTFRLDPRSSAARSLGHRAHRQGIRSSSAATRSRPSS